MTPRDCIRSTLAFLALAASAVFADSPAPPDVSESSMPRMIIQMPSGETHLTPSVMTEEGKLGRWIGLETASISSRYRYIENFSATTTASNIQDQIAFRGQLKLDPGGRFTLHAGLFTGGSFSGGWNNSGAGTGAPQSNVFVKQLYLDARIAKGIDGAYGGLEIARGESTEITSYDNVGGMDEIRLPRCTNTVHTFSTSEAGVKQGYAVDAAIPDAQIT